MLNGVASKLEKRIELFVVLIPDRDDLFSSLSLDEALMIRLI